MAEREPSRSFSRRHLLAGAVGLGTLFLGGGAPQRVDRLPYPLVEGHNTDGRFLFDPRAEELAMVGLENVVFQIDPSYPQNNRGERPSLALSSTTARPHVRVVSQERAPNPGWLVDYREAQAGETRTHPVTTLRQGDREVVFVATGETPEKVLQQPMQAYQLTFLDDGGGVVLGNGVYLGEVRVPSSLHLRDA